MTEQAPAEGLGAQLDRLTADQSRGLAHVLYASHTLDHLSRRPWMEAVELEAFEVRDIARALGQAACRIAQLPPQCFTGGVDEAGRELLLCHVVLEKVGNFWGCRSKLWGNSIRPSCEVTVLDQPASEAALAITLVQLARTVLSGGSGAAVVEFDQALDRACDGFEEALYPTPTPAENLEVMRERQARSSGRERPLDEEPEESEPSFHGTGGVD
jgi:hypothetical protein